MPCKINVIYVIYCDTYVSYFVSMWPQFVKDRIQSTYAFFGGSCLLTAAAAAGVFRSPRLLSLASRGGLMVSSTR